MTAEQQAALEAANRICHNDYPPGPERYKMFVEDAQLVAGALLEAYFGQGLHKELE